MFHTNRCGESLYVLSVSKSVATPRPWSSRRIGNVARYRAFEEIEIEIPALARRVLVPGERDHHACAGPPRRRRTANAASAKWSRRDSSSRASPARRRRALRSRCRRWYQARAHVDVVRGLAVRLDGDAGAGGRRADRPPLAPESERAVHGSLPGAGSQYPDVVTQVLSSSIRTDPGPATLSGRLPAGFGHGPVGDHHLPLG